MKFRTVYFSHEDLIECELANVNTLNAQRHILTQSAALYWFELLQTAENMN